jgi:deoxyribodipyrimidine photo-lyase
VWKKKLKDGETQMSTAIWWIRRDLRLSDNVALTSAIKKAENILPVFILDPTLIQSEYVGEKRWAFLLAGLHNLDSNLAKRGSSLIIRHGEPMMQLEKVIHESGAETIFAEEDFSPYAQGRDHRIARQLPLRLMAGLTLRHPASVLKENGLPYTVFTPYSRAWKASPLPDGDSLLPTPDRIPASSETLSEGLPSEPALPASIPFPPSEAEGQRRLQAFAQPNNAPIYRYNLERDRMDLDGTSRLSPYLRFGMISIRQAVVAAASAIESAHGPEAHRGAEVWLNELIWREFYFSILFHFPYVRQMSFREPLRRINWVNDKEAFHAWCEGRTGYPIIDAAMRQLLHIGWMHNRARMIAASFLVKDLLIDWHWGEKWFMQHLLDGDPAANNGGWQWTAGTGTDAAPYFRIFNPVLQGKKFDPQGGYIRQWVPELSRVPEKSIHEPWKMPAELQRSSACMIGKDYPAPIIDHSLARLRTLEVYQMART